MMHKLSIVMLTGIASLVLVSGSAQADPKGKTGAKITGQTMTVTGCLTQDAKEKNEYMIAGEDGKTWGLKSHTVKLGEHLNHKITVTGKVTKGGHETEAGDMNVTNLKMVSE